MRSVLLVLLLATPAWAQPGGLPFPRAPRSEAPSEDLRRLALRWAPDVYQDTDDTDAVSDLLTDIDFDGDADMRNNWESLEGRSYDEVLGQGSVYWWGSSSETHHFIGYSFFHPRDWADYQSPTDSIRTFVRNKLDLGNDQHENDMEGVLLVISKATGEPVLMVTQAHNNFWQYGSSEDWGDGLDDLDGPIRRDPVTGRPQVFIEAKGHGAYGSPKKTNFEPGKGDGVVYTRARRSHHGDWSGADVAGYRLHDLEPWWDRFQAVKPGEANETYTREDGKIAFVGDTHGADAANPPWGWKDKDYSDAVNRLWFRQPARFVERVVEPKREFSSRITERSFPLRQPLGPRRSNVRPPRCGITGRLGRH